MMRFVGNFAANLATLLTVAVWALVAFGIDTTDADNALAFVRAVDRWQHNPDFRKVTIEYMLLGSDAMRGHVAGLSGARAVMLFRSIPYLPDKLRAAPGSDVHYREFSKGPLSAYFHLIGEQGIPAAINGIEKLGAVAGGAGDADIRGFLDSFKLRDNTIATDAGAIASVRRLLSDIHPSQPLTIRDDPTEMLLAHAREVAASMRLPIDPDQMTPDQQRAIYLALDEHVHRSDPQLWRTKQLVDLLCGIWGQAYGQTYAETITPVLEARGIARSLWPLIAIVLASRLLPRPRRR